MDDWRTNASLLKTEVDGSEMATMCVLLVDCSEVTAMCVLLVDVSEVAAMCVLLVATSHHQWLNASFLPKRAAVTGID